MDEKTAELRDLFVSVTDAEEVTERQEESPGSLASETDVEERLATTVATMRDRLEFATTLSDAALVTVVRRFYAGDTDAEIARALGDAASKTVARARLDLHLIRDTDRDAPFDMDAFRSTLDDAPTNAALADTFDVSESTIRWYRRVVSTERERRRVNDRFRDEFEDALGDRELAERLTSDVQEDGLEGATEGQETNLNF
ncbi:MAG: conditioned medium-induced protein 4 [Halobacteriaceae archaeon]